MNDFNPVFFWLEFNSLFQKKKINFCDFMIKYQKNIFGGDTNISISDFFLYLTILLDCKEYEEFELSIEFLKNNLSTTDFNEGITKLKLSLQQKNNENLLSYLQNYENLELCDDLKKMNFNN